MSELPYANEGHLFYNYKMQDDRVPPDPDFLEDLIKATDGVPNRASVACGIRQQTAELMMNGRPMPRLLLDEARRNFYHREDGSLRVRMLQVLSGPRKLRYKILRQLWACVDMMVRYRDTMYIAERAKVFYQFPPRSVMLQLHKAIEAVHDLLTEIHKQCPELDRMLYRYHPGYLKILKKEIANGDCRVHERRMRQVQADLEALEGREPVPEGDSGVDSGVRHQQPPGCAAECHAGAGGRAPERRGGNSPRQESADPGAGEGAGQA